MHVLAAGMYTTVPVQGTVRVRAKRKYKPARARCTALGRTGYSAVEMKVECKIATVYTLLHLLPTHRGQFDAEHGGECNLRSCD